MFYDLLIRKQLFKNSNAEIQGFCDAYTFTYLYYTFTYTYFAVYTQLVAKRLNFRDVNKNRNSQNKVVFF